MTEEELAAVMPLGQDMVATEILKLLNIPGLNIHVLKVCLVKYGESGFIGHQKRSNRAHLWTRLREPKKERSARNLENVQRVTIGGSHSNHFGTEHDRPISVTLPAFPERKRA